MKKVIAIILIFIMIFSLSACSGSQPVGGNEKAVVKPGNDQDRLKLTILIARDARDYAENNCMKTYVDKFEQTYGVEVNYVYLGDSSISLESEKQYRTELASKLYLKEGPELIFVEPHFQVDPYIKQDVVADLAGKVKNIDKIYKGLLRDGTCFVPIGLMYSKWTVNKDILKELGVKEPDVDWTLAQFYEMYEKWYKRYKYFTSDEYYYMQQHFTNNFQIYSIEDKHVNIDIAALIKAIQEIRAEIFSGTFQLPKDYKYENYYNMLHEYSSAENKKMRELLYSDQYQKDSVARRGGGNLLISDFLEEKGAMYLPHISDEKYALFHASGFMVNKNGKNLDLAYEFLNGLLAEEFQLSMYKAHQEGAGFSQYPVNKDLEEVIRKLEIDNRNFERAVQLKEYALGQIKEERVRLYAFAHPEKESKILSMISKAMTKFIFADTAYTEEQMTKELQKLKEQCDIYLSE